MTDFNLIKHNIMVGSQVFEIDVRAKNVDGKVYLDSDHLVKKQKELARDLLQKTDEFDVHVFNYALNVSGEKGARIAKCLEVSPSHISQLRHGKGDPTKQFWKFFRLVMTSLLSEKRERDFDRIVDRNMPPPNKGAAA